MKKIIKIIILSVLIMIPNWAVAGNSKNLHTHTNTPIELGFVSANYAPEFKLAGVCFLGQGDCGSGSFGKGDEDMGISLPSTPEEQCQNEGFVTACKAGEITDTICPYQPNYKKCKCNPCVGYDYTFTETTVQGYVADGSCQSCEVIKYKRKENPCSGYKTCECGGEIGANVCYIGSVKKFSNCKSCTSPSTKCEIGSIYYADGTCLSPIAHNNSKVVLGVVVYKNPGGTGGQVMAKSPVGNAFWSTEYVDIASLPNYDNYQTVIKDYDSCDNTDKIIAQGNSNTYPAAWAARNYTPTKETKGKWCLPAAGILSNAYVNITLVNEGIAKLGGTQLDREPYTWSSSEFNYNASWIYCSDACSSQLGLAGDDKSTSNFYHNNDIRPVLEF